MTSDPIDVQMVLNSVMDPSAGGVVLFLGVVRNQSEAGSVQGIDYEAYEKMVEETMMSIEKEIYQKWPIKKVTMLHQIGYVKVGKVSVAIAVSSEHRREAFEACRYAIEEIKHRVPIWKKELLQNGNKVWVQGELSGSDLSSEDPSYRCAH